MFHVDEVGTQVWYCSVVFHARHSNEDICMQCESSSIVVYQLTRGGPAAKNFLLKQIDHSVSCTLSLDTHSCWVFSVRLAGRLSALSEMKCPAFDKLTFSSLLLWLFKQFSLRNSFSFAVISHSFASTVLSSKSRFRLWVHLWWSHSDDLWIAPESCRCNEWMLSYDSICCFHCSKVSDPHSEPRRCHRINACEQVEEGNLTWVLGFIVLK